MELEKLLESKYSSYKTMHVYLYSIYVDILMTIKSNKETWQDYTVFNPLSLTWGVWNQRDLQ